MPRDTRKPKTNRRARLYEVTELATKFFEKMLYMPEGKLRDYLANRGINSETIRHFRLGFAPLGFNKLVILVKTVFTQI